MAVANTSYEKPAAQTAHLGFDDTKANTEKPKEPVFLPTLDRKMSGKNVN